MFTLKELELLQKSVYEAYRSTGKRKSFIEDTLGECEDDALYNMYCDEMGHYMDIKLKLDKLIDEAALKEVNTHEGQINIIKED